MRQRFFLVLFFLLSSACAHRVYLPDPPMQTPEAGGELFAGTAGVHTGSTTSIVVVNDVSTSPPTELPKSIEANSPMPHFDFNLGLGLSEVFEIYWNRSAGLRAQIWGDRNSLGWKSMLFAGVITTGGSSQRTGSSGGIEYDAKTTLDGYDVGISVGNRTDEKNLFYGTLARFSGEAKTEVKHVNLGALYKYDDSFSHTSLALGYKFGSAFYMNVEVIGLHTTWSDADSRTTLGWGAGLGYAW